ncbi:nucleoside-diphosphate-sugar epimerase [Beggiatoa sp. PS]|nr:nucleoside-diphosphate-sugar epimerase [Beggiatoa sp. PS]
MDVILQAIDNPKYYGKHYNLCGPKVYTLQELVTYTAKLMGVKRCIISLGDKGSERIAKLMEFKFAPSGKPYSLDNYRSSKIDSVCGNNNHLPRLGITPSTVETIVPKYLLPSTSRALYPTFREHARR